MSASQGSPEAFRIAHDALRRLAAEDYRGNQPQSVRTAREALDRIDAVLRPPARPAAPPRPEPDVPAPLYRHLIDLRGRTR